MALVRFVPHKAEQLEISLPASKSISNRLLIISSLCQGVKISGLSSAHDTLVLKRALNKFFARPDEHSAIEIDVADAGTAARFLLARLSIEKGVFILKGSPRMHQRPVKPLLDALRLLGAKIEYLEENGFLPLKIYGRKPVASKVRLDTGLSSQFASALMMVAPAFTDDFTIEPEGNMGSKPYVHMTARLMQKAGCHVFVSSEKIRINGAYQAADFECEKDWSAASYFYLAAALAPGNPELIMELTAPEKSVQGDAQIAALFRRFGILTRVRGNQISIQKQNGFALPAFFEADFSDIPDMAQTFVVLCAALAVPAQLTGLQSLRHKETDRIEALICELRKMGAAISAGKDDRIEIKASPLKATKAVLSVYQDHRMAMALAPLAFLLPEIRLEDETVVQKSFPAFWSEMKKTGLCLSSAH